MRRLSRICWSLTLALLPGTLRAGAIRPTAEMGPRARRILEGIKHERVQRDTARERRQRVEVAPLARFEGNTKTLGVPLTEPALGLVERVFRHSAVRGVEHSLPEPIAEFIAEFAEFME